MKEAILIFGILLIITRMMTVKANGSGAIQMEKVSLQEARPWLDAFLESAEVPEGYRFYSAHRVKTDGATAYLFRYEKPGSGGLLGEHFSFIVSGEEKRVLGFTRMDGTYTGKKMISREETERIAKDFLRRLDATLASDLENLWIAKHDEEIIVNGKKMIVAGMKYKCYRAAQNDYTWVIVGHDGAVITFERNIQWNNAEHKRITEKWLHDSWLVENHVAEGLFSRNGLKVLLKKHS